MRKLIMTLLTLVVFASILLPINNGYIIEKAEASKTQTVNFSESTKQSQSRTITIPNLQSVDGISVNTGNVNYSVNGDQVTIHVSGGSSVRSTYNPTKYSKYATDYRTSSSNSFSSSISYNSGGYSGTLSKSGDSFVDSGSASDSKTVNKSLDGFSGHYGILQQSKTDGNWYFNERTEALVSDYSIRYDESSYSGTLYRTDIVKTGTETFDEPSDPIPGVKYYLSKTYYKIYYSGTVSKPDTRIWRQDYSGYVYSGGYDYYYAYTVTLEYTDNQPPTTPGIFTSPNNSTKAKGGDSLTVSWGLSTDPDRDPIRYQLQFYNGSTWSTVTSNTTSTSYTWTVPTDITISNAKFRVRAYDGKEYSSYRESDSFSIYQNSDPEIELTSPSNNLPIR